MDMQNRKRSETTEQIALFNWADRIKAILPELALLYHVPNEGKRTNGGIAKAAGLKRGVPDICLPVSSNGFHGLYIELKYGKNKETKAQEEFMALLEMQDYKTAVCYGFMEARKKILEYLSEPGRMPKETCLQAPWMNGKCQGMTQPQGMFTERECTYCENRSPNEVERSLMENLKGTSGDFTKGIMDAIFILSHGKPYKSCTMEDTLETVNENLSLLVKCRDLTIGQSAEVLTVAIEAYQAGKRGNSA